MKGEENPKAVNTCANRLFVFVNKIGSSSLMSPVSPITAIVAGHAFNGACVSLN